VFRLLLQLAGFHGGNDGPIIGARGRHWRWPLVRDAHIEQHPYCAVCGSGKDVIAHHKKPVHLFPELELDPANLITLCEGRKACNCHLEFGHLGDWKLYNPSIEMDAPWWYFKRAAARE
jgi:5-methylcytosine-specific restriction protein A